jgi:hypothetical protein
MDKSLHCLNLHPARNRTARAVFIQSHARTIKITETDKIIGESGALFGGWIDWMPDSAHFPCQWL